MCEFKGGAPLYFGAIGVVRARIYEYKGGAPQYFGAIMAWISTVYARRKAAHLYILERL